MARATSTRGTTTPAPGDEAPVDEAPVEKAPVDPPHGAGLTVAALLETRWQETLRPAETVSSGWRWGLRELYAGTDRRATRFQWAVASIDLVIVGFFILGPVLQQWRGYLWIDYAVALLLAADLSARAIASVHLGRWLRRPVVWVDLVVLATLLAPLWLANLGFLRILRLWSMSQKDIFWRALRRRGYGEWEDVGRAGINLVTCLFVITGFIYTVFASPGSGMEGWIDALYFTVATITTTGFGDITLPGPAGKLTAIVTMIVGISLFVRLAQALFRPYKVSFRCPTCALMRHEPDAVHCKACGQLLTIPDTGGE